MISSKTGTSLARIAFALAILALTSCSAVVSYRQQEPRIPSEVLDSAAHSDAVKILKAGDTSANPQEAAARFFDAARMVGPDAVAGDAAAMALYNHAVARLVEAIETEHSLPWGKNLEMGDGESRRTLRVQKETDIVARGRRIVVLDTLKFEGRYAGVQATRDGLGAPVVAVLSDEEGYRSRFEPRESFVSLTAILRFENASSATLEFHDPLQRERIAISGRNPTLAADFSAPAALGLAWTRVDRLGLLRLLNPQKFSNDTQLIRLQSYDRNRIPVLLIHGLQDTPATWFPMYQELLCDPELRQHYQFWVFSYPSGLPYPHTAALLRRELDGVRRAFPDHKNLVLVGHSMGGIISRLMVTDAGDTIWKGMFGKSPDEFVIPGQSRQLLLDALVFNKRNDVDRAVFIATPHRGSVLASNWVGRMASRLVRLPTYITDIRNDVASVLTADVAGIQLNFAPNSIDTLSPNSRFVREVNNIPVAPGIPFHSIIGDRGRGNTPDSSDGVVAYWSSHMEGAASEKIVPSGHGAHQHPEAISEVKRILKLHLQEHR